MISNFIKKIIHYFLNLFFSFIKYLTRQLTGLCELQRICYSTDQGAKRCLLIEKSIKNSKSPILISIDRKLTDLSSNEGKFNCNNKYEVTQLIENAVESICKIKSINPIVHEEFVDAMRVSLLQIYGYKQLCFDVFKLKNTPYDSNNKKHVNYLLEIWNSLNPNDHLDDLISKKWLTIGFQGNDPKTDFRGMNILGLINLHYFVTNYSSIARSILLHSNHPKNGYPFAITGINLTHMAYILLNNSKLKTHFFNAFNKGTMCLDDFHKVYSYLFVHFDRLWLKEKPIDVMEFSYIKDKFLEKLNNQLDDENCKLILESNLDI